MVLSRVVFWHVTSLHTIARVQKALPNESSVMKYSLSVFCRLVTCLEAKIGYGLTVLCYINFTLTFIKSCSIRHRYLCSSCIDLNFLGKFKALCAMLVRTVLILWVVRDNAAHVLRRDTGWIEKCMSIAGLAMKLITTMCAATSRSSCLDL